MSDASSGSGESAGAPGANAGDGGTASAAPAPARDNEVGRAAPSESATPVSPSIEAQPVAQETAPSIASPSVAEVAEPEPPPVDPTAAHREVVERYLAEKANERRAEEAQWVNAIKSPHDDFQFSANVMQAEHMYEQSQKPQPLAANQYMEQLGGALTNAAQAIVDSVDAARGPRTAALERDQMDAYIATMREYLHSRHGSEPYTTIQSAELEHDEPSRDRSR